MTSYKYIEKYGSIEEFNAKENIDISVLNHNTVRNLFTNFEKYEITHIPFCGLIDYNVFATFLHRNNININTLYYYACFENKNLKFQILN